MKKVLLVDDDKAITDVVSLILISKDIEVKVNNTGNGLPEIIEEFKPNLILLDVRLPGGLGTEICKELKKKYPVPIIIFSAELNIAYKECDADNIINKPFDLIHFWDLVNSYL